MPTVREFLFGFKFSATDYVSPVLKNIEGNIKKLNESVANTAKWREAGTNMAMIGGGMAAMGAAIAAPLVMAVKMFGSLQDAQQHLLTALPAGAEGIRELAAASKLAETASVRFNVSQEDVLENVYLGIAAGLKFKDAMTNAMTSIEVAKGTQGSIADTGRLMGEIVAHFGDTSLKGAAAAAQIKHYGDVVAYAVRMKDFRNIGELNDAMTESIGVAKAAHIPFNDYVAQLAAFSQAGFHGASAGEALEESLNSLGRGGFGKAGVQVAHFASGAIDSLGSLINLTKAYQHRVINLQTFELLSKSFGIRGTRALALNVKDLEKARSEFSSSVVNGAALQGANITMASLNEQLGRAHQAFIQMAEVVGGILAPAVTKLADMVVPVALGFADFMKHHHDLAKIATYVGAIGAGTLLVGGGLAIASGALMGFASFLPAVAAFAGAIRITAIASKVWAAAQWLVNAAMDANPIGLLIIGVAALSVAIYELYKHWSAIEKLGSAMYAAGVHIVKEIGRGIMAGAVWAEKAISHVADKIRSYLPPFSPAKAGPLTHLHHIRIIETIADSMKPAPALAAMTRVSRAIALAVPLTLSPMLAGAAFAGPRIAPRASLGAGASSYASERSGGSGGGGNVVINYAPNIQAGTGTDFKELLTVLRQHSRELLDMMESEQAHRARRSF